MPSSSAGFGGVIDDGGAVFFARARNAEQASNACRAFRADGCVADGVMFVPAFLARARRATVLAGVSCRSTRRRADDASPAGRRRCSRRSWPVFGASKRTCRIVPLHLDALPDPAGRRAVVRRLDFHAAIEMDRALAVAVIAKRFEWERAERRLLLRKHRGYLPLRGAVDARVSPARLPAIPNTLAPPRASRSGGRGAASSARDRRRLRPSLYDRDRRRGTGERDHAVVRQHVAIQRIEGGVVDVGRQDAFAQIVDDDSRGRCPPSGEMPARAAPPRSARSIATRAGALICASSPA